MVLWMLSYHLNISELIYSSSDELVMAHIIWHAIIIVVFPKMTQPFPGFFSSHLWILYHHVSPLQRHFKKFAGVVMQCTLHCHSILTTPLPLRSGNAVLICIFATHSNATPASHSNATPKPLLKYTSMPLRSAHSIATPLLPLQCHSHRTLQCHSGVSLEC